MRVPIGSRAVLVLLATGLFVSCPVLAKSAPWVGESFSGTACRGGAQGYGPFDYLARFGLAKNLNIVEEYHFTSSVESLRRGKSGTVAGDIDYT